MSDSVRPHRWQPTRLPHPWDSPGKNTGVVAQLYIHMYVYTHIWGFPGSLDGKESACNAGDLGLIPGSRRSPGEMNDNPLQYFCLENLHGQRSLVGYRATSHEVPKSRTWLKWFSIAYLNKVLKNPHPLEVYSVSKIFWKCIIEYSWEKHFILI